MRPGFNIAGPCIPGEHYMLPPERRLGRVMELVEDHRYFTLHAGRQVGKTTSARWMMRHYNASGRFRAVWVDLQSAREQPDPAPAFRTVLGAFQHALTIYVPALTRPSKVEVEELLDDPSRAIRGYPTSAMACVIVQVLNHCSVIVPGHDGQIGGGDVFNAREAGWPAGSPVSDCQLLSRRCAGRFQVRRGLRGPVGLGGESSMLHVALSESSYAPSLPRSLAPSLPRRRRR